MSSKQLLTYAHGLALTQRLVAGWGVGASNGQGRSKGLAEIVQRPRVM